jgi:hypothetical protein
MVVLAGVAVGFEDGSHKINHIIASRDTHKSNVSFIDN